MRACQDVKRENSRSYRTVYLTAICLAFLSVVRECRSRIISAYVMPHGGIALDPGHFNTTNTTAKTEAWEIHRACVDVGKEIASVYPDVILLSTPHGIADYSNFVLYLNRRGVGFADTDNCVCPPCCYMVNVSLASEIAARIRDEFSAQSNVSGLSSFGPPGGEGVEPFPLRWAEVIPLHFVPFLNESETKTVILSQPSRRYTEDVAMIPELLTLGQNLYTFLEELDERVVVIISSDLAHTHDKSGPYGYSNASQPFDDACGKWASTLDADSLLKTAAEYVDRAKSCGYTGLVMLHGLMLSAGSFSWHPELYVNHHPSYYGMMVASFTRKIA
ncbi:LOW QUALITY PROTEIN: protein CA_C1420-like [Liolophura sinensis]|uniref:LOW QUALITY PROTEIN: protein CA_C1420-like n=1 Tax=Liolophura sinensis TaxID=3198878 RepID=UPI0031584A0E